MQRIVMFTSSAMVVLLAFFMLRLTLDKSTFSAGLPSKKGETCYAVKGSPTNNVYQGSRLLSGVEVYFVEAWDTRGFNEGNCDPGQKVTLKQYTVESKFEPVEAQLRFRVYQSGTLAHEEVCQISDDVKKNYRISASSEHELSLSTFSLPNLWVQVTKNRRNNMQAIIVNLDLRSARGRSRTSLAKIWTVATFSIR